MKFIQSSNKHVISTEHLPFNSITVFSPHCTREAMDDVSMAFGVQLHSGCTALVLAFSSKPTYLPPSSPVAFLLWQLTQLFSLLVCLSDSPILMYFPRRAR